MHSADYAVAGVGLSVRLSDTRQYSVEMAKQTLKFSAWGRNTILAFPYQTVSRYVDGDPLKGASNARGYRKIAIFDQPSQFISETIRHRATVTIEGE